MRPWRIWPAGGVARKYGAPFEVNSCKERFFQVLFEKYKQPGGRGGTPAWHRVLLMWQQGIDLPTTLSWGSCRGWDFGHLSR